MNATLYTMLFGIILGLLGWINQAYIKDEWRFIFVTWPYARANVRPYVLTAAKEQALEPGDRFRECAPKQDCPDMVVVPAGSFTMGGTNAREQPRHTVTFAKPFAASKYEVTFADWDACVAGGGCNSYRPDDQGWGRGQQPVININWNDAEAYVAWLSEVSGKTYRLPSEAEYEYAMRAGTTTTYPWGDDIKLNGQPMANCTGCGGGRQWDGIKTSPVGSFPPNKFGLHDTAGNVWVWTQDCVHLTYDGAPTDGSAWLAEHSGNCTNRMVRGGSWLDPPVALTSALRPNVPASTRGYNTGFRVVRTLTH